MLLFNNIAHMKKYRVNCQAERGITLVESMVTVAIMVLLLALAVPSFKSSIESNRRTVLINQLYEDLTFARSEAIKRNVRVEVCPSTTGTSCSGINDWSKGWIVFAQSIGGIPWSPGKPILRSHEALTLPPNWIAQDNIISATSHFAEFKPTGESTASFRICMMLQSDFDNYCKSGDASDASRGGILWYTGQYANVVVTNVGRMRIELSK